MNNTKTNLFADAAELIAIALLDETADAPLTESQQFANFLRRRDAQRAAVAAELRSRETAKAELRRPFRVLAAFARS